MHCNLMNSRSAAVQQHTMLLYCCCAPYCAAGVVHRCSRGCAPVHQVAEVVHTRLCAHNLCAHTTSVLTTPEHPSCCPPVTLLLPSCYPPVTLLLCSGLCTTTHSDISVHTSCSHNVAPRCTLCAHTSDHWLSQYWQYMHSYMGVSSVFWPVHSQDCSQPFTLTSRCTHHVHTICITLHHFVHRSG